MGRGPGMGYSWSVPSGIASRRFVRCASGGLYRQVSPRTHLEVPIANLFTELAARAKLKKPTGELTYDEDEARVRELAAATAHSFRDLTVWFPAGGLGNCFRGSS